jgi:NTE family protein
VPLPIPPPIIEGFSRMRIGQALTLYLDAMDITSRMLTELRLKVDRPEVVIRPDVYEYGILDKVEPQKLIQAGYQAAAQAYPEIKKSLSWSNSMLRIMRSPYKPKLSQILKNDFSSDSSVQK